VNINNNKNNPTIIVTTIQIRMNMNRKNIVDKLLLGTKDTSTDVSKFAAVDISSKSLILFVCILLIIFN
jgi:hypothetical protein